MNDKAEYMEINGSKKDENNDNNNNNNGTDDDEMADNMPELQKNGRTDIVKTRSNQDRQQQGWVDQWAVSGREHRGLGRRGIIVPARSRTNKHKTTIGNETMNGSRNSDVQQQ